MRKLFLMPLAALALALPGCNSLGSVPASPATVANATVLDEQVGQTVELAYKAFRTAMELAVDVGKLKGANASKVAALDNKAYAAIQVMRSAYRAGNSASYVAAAREAKDALAQAVALVKGA